MGLIIIVVIILFIIANTSHGKKETISFNSPNNTDKIFFQQISGSFYYTSSKNSSLPFVINKNFLTFLQASSSTDSKSNYNNLNIKEKISFQSFCEYIEFILGGTTRFLEDEIKGLYSYEALKQRLIGNPFAVYEKKDLSRPVILLEKLTKEELFQLFKNIRNVFAEYDETKYLVTNNEIEKFMQYLFNRFGANSFLTPRESIRQFIGLLTQIQNNLNIKFNTNKILYFEISRLRWN